MSVSEQIQIHAVVVQSRKQLFELVVAVLLQKAERIFATQPNDFRLSEQVILEVGLDHHLFGTQPYAHKEILATDFTMLSHLH